MQVQSLGHVVLKVRSLESSVPFYANVLGLREVARLDERIVFFSISGNHHDLALLETAIDAPEAPGNAPGLAHVALKIGDDLDTLREARDWLEHCNVAIDRITDHRVSQSLYLHDPDGNQIELFVDHPARIWKDDPTAVATIEPLNL